MTTHLLDTNVVSAMRRPDRLPAPVREALSALPVATVAISVITVEEVARGIARIDNAGDQRWAATLRTWAERDLARLATLEVTSPIADLAGRIGAERTLGLADRLIAATAAVHGLVLVTRNVKDMTTNVASTAGLRLMDPWAALD